MSLAYKYLMTEARSPKKPSAQANGKVALRNIHLLLERSDEDLEADELKRELAELEEQWRRGCSRRELELELWILKCGIGHIISDKEMTDADITRMFLAVDRLMRG